MDELSERIIEAARELSGLIRKSGVFLNYEKSIRELRNDQRSREILEKLVRYGKDLDEKQRKGEELRLEQSQEVEMTRKELEENSLIKNYLVHQKEYLNLLNAVMDRIRTPREEGGE